MLSIRGLRSPNFFLKRFSTMIESIGRSGMSTPVLVKVTRVLPKSDGKSRAFQRASLRIVPPFKAPSLSFDQVYPLRMDPLDP